MKKLLLPFLIFQILILSCSEKEANFQNEELIGVWSGLLFQTESRYDSIVLLASEPPEALLYKNGEATTYPIQQHGNSLSFKGAGGLRFDASLSDETQSIKGVLTDNLWAQSLNFVKIGNNWRCDIAKPEIIDTDYMVYLEFYRDSIGAIQAHIQSNKENRKLHFTIEKVQINGNEIDFSITNSRFGISAFYKKVEKSISLNYSNAGGTRTVSLLKLSDDQLLGYTPRPVNEKYVYKIPDARGSNMPVASLEEVNMDKSALKFMEEMNDGYYEHLHSILITKNKKLVLEEYFHGYNREQLHDIRSAFKSIASLSVGKAMMKNNSLKVENAILNYYPQYEVKDALKNSISVHHALTMSSGIALEDEDKMQWDNNDWVKYKLNLPMEHTPGEVFEYSSGGSNLLTGVIQQTADTYLPLFLYEDILLPMGIDKFQMLTSPQWRGYLAGNFYLRPIDFTKFGLLVLNKGEWNGKQIIAESWIEESTKPHIKNNYPKNSNYGYLWRLLERNVGGKKVKTIEAWGNGGQFLIVIPELEMTITFTSGNYNLFPEMEKPFEILNKYIFPAVKVSE